MLPSVRITLCLSFTAAGCNADLNIVTSGNQSGAAILTYDKEVSKAAKEGTFIPLGGQCVTGNSIGVRWSEEEDYFTKTVCTEGRWNVEVPIQEFEKHSQGVIAESIKDSGEVIIQLGIDFDLEQVRPKISINESIILAHNQNSFFLSGTCSASGQGVEISGDLSFSTQCAKGIWQKTIDTSKIPDGSLTVVAKHHNEHLWPAIPATRSLLKDTVVPTLTFDTLGPINTANADNYLITGTCSQTGDDIVILGADSGTVKCLAGVFALNLDTHLISDGATATFTGIITDRAGNTSTPESITILKDLTAPVFISLVGAHEASDTYINSDESSSSNPIASLDASGHSNAVFSNILDNSTPITCDSSITYTQSSIPLINSMPNTDGSYAICVKLTNEAGNTTYGKSTIFIRDTSGPVFTSLAPANQASDGYININEMNSASSAVALTASNYQDAHYSVPLLDTPTVSCNSSQTYGNSNAPTIDSIPATDGEYAICVRLTDAAGNTSFGKSSIITKDTTLPAITLTSPVKTNTTYNAEAESDDAVSVSWAYATGPGSITLGSASAKNTTISASADGVYVVLFTAVDVAGNSDSALLTLTWDTTPPVAGSMVAAHEAADTYINAAEAASTNVFATHTGASGYTSVTYSDILSDSPSIACDLQDYPHSAIPTIDTMPNDDGYYRVCAKLADDAGNISYTKTNRVNRDTTIVFASLSLLNEATDLIINIADIAANNLLVSTVVGSGYNSSHYLQTLSANDCSSETYSSTSRPRAGILTAGTRKICVRLTDLAGNIVYGSSADFIVNTDVPTINLHYDYAKSSTFRPFVATGGANLYQWSVTSGNAANITFSSTTQASPDITASTPGEYRLRLTVSNSYGNSAYAEKYLYWHPAQGAHTIFHTFNLYAGDLGGLAGADAKCQAEAAMGGLTGTYRALLSTSTVNANERIVTNYPILRRDGALVARNSADLWDGEIINSIAVNSIGSLRGDPRPWSGSQYLGNAVANRHCNDWTSSSSSIGAEQGHSKARFEHWFGDGFYVATCNVYSELFCLSEDGEEAFTFSGTAAKVGRSIDIKFVVPATVTGADSVELRQQPGSLSPTCSTGTLVNTWTLAIAPNRKLSFTDTVTASSPYSYIACIKSGSTVLRSYALENITSSPMQHLAFVTQEQVTPGTLIGVLNANVFCQTSADNIQLGGTYKAIMSNGSGDHVKDRLQINGPIYNTNSQLVASDADDLWDGSLEYPLAYSQTGYSWGPVVATGSTAAGEWSGYACSSWTQTGSQSTYGLSNETSDQWISNIPGAISACSAKQSIYCISQ